MTDISIAMSMVLAAALLVGLFLWFKARSSERRMSGMMQRSGLSPDMARQSGCAPVIGQARRRCRDCQSEDVCERWLAGEVNGSNDFCPNAQVFEQLKVATRH